MENKNIKATNDKDLNVVQSPKLKIGPPFKFSSAEQLQKAANDYFTFVDNNPNYKYEFIRGGDMAGQIIPMPIQRAYINEGFCEFTGITSDTLNDMLNKRGVYADIEEEIFQTLLHIRDKIKRSQFDGAMENRYNANFVSRLNQLSDNVDVTSGNEPITSININIAKLNDDK
jgi:hypothetical protein